MSTNQPISDTPASPPPSGGLQPFARNPRQTGYGLLVLAGLLAIIPIAVSFKYGWSGALVSIWGGLLSACCVLAGTVMLGLRPEGQLTMTERVRVIFLTLGGAMGFFTALLGLCLPFTASYRTVMSGGLAEWRKEPWVLVTDLAALFGGLILMFLSLQLARGLEHSRPILRRLLYGYNAVLGSLVLLVILLLVNVLSFVRLAPFGVMSKTLDWTASKQYTLNDSFAKLLESIKEPIHVYAFITQASGPLLMDIEQLLENCRNTNPKFTYTFLSRDLNLREINDLRKKYTFPEPDGLLVVYGDEAGKPNSEFIRRDELSQANFRPDGRRGRFTGENALYKAIDYLSQGKTKPVIYFTQGNGEAEVKAGAGRRESIAGLFDRLEQGNFTPKELRYDGKESADALGRRLLDEAAVVVVPGPTQHLPRALVDGLRHYVKGDGKKHGKLIVLFDVTIDQDGKMVQTGLEPLVAEYQVRVNNDRVINPLYQELGPQFPTPRNFLAILNPRTDNPIALGFRQPGRTYIFKFDDSRTLEVQSNEAAPPGAGARAEPLLLVPQNLFAWSEKNLNADPVALAEARLKNEELLFSVADKPAMVIAAAVSEQKGGGLPPGHPMMPQQPTGESHPVMVVFGDASWIDDTHRDGNSWSLFNSCLAWLRERPDTGVKIDPREPDIFSPNVPPESSNRLLLLPLFLMIFCIIGMGVGVWVVRRR